MPFVPGVIPEGAEPFKVGYDPKRNLEGRSKGKSISTLLNELLEKKIKDIDGTERTRAEIIALKLLSKATNAKNIDNTVLKAIEQILDRSEGKAKQTIIADFTSNGESLSNSINIFPPGTSENYLEIKEDE
ncbi:MAG TPA: hypothetical protein VIJ57_05645 [Hanamia sp.]